MTVTNDIAATSWVSAIHAFFHVLSAETTIV